MCIPFIAPLNTECSNNLVYVISGIIFSSFPTGKILFCNILYYCFYNAHLFSLRSYEIILRKFFIYHFNYEKMLLQELLCLLFCHDIRNTLYLNCSGSYARIHWFCGAENPPGLAPSAPRTAARRCRSSWAGPWGSAWCPGWGWRGTPTGSSRGTWPGPPCPHSPARAGYPEQ